MNFSLRSVVGATQFNRELLETVFERARKIESDFRSGKKFNSMDGKVMTTLFFEPSTRTRLSFESAMCRLGGKVIGTENAKEFSSFAKGESIEDSIKVISKYCDVIVMRHYEEGASLKAAAVSTAPIINAGDGPGEHPTQGLLDLYTILKSIGRLDNISVALVGDLYNGRTVRSLACMLSNFNSIKLIFVSPKRLSMKDDVKEKLKAKGVAFTETEDLKVALKEADVVYMTRIQKERFSTNEEYDKYKDIYILDSEKVSLMRKDSIIMHPLPRLKEINCDVDADSRAKYFEEAENGLYVRMALLELLLT